jgi:hypothetical protein
MTDSLKLRGRRWTFALALPVLMLISMTGCAPQVIELRGGPTDCAWSQGIYLGEDSIHALSDQEVALRNAGQHERAFRLRLDRKAIGDHNKLFERNCGAKP